MVFFLTLGDALHERFVRLKAFRTGVVALAVEVVHVCPTPRTHVPLRAQLTACRTL